MTSASPSSPAAPTPRGGGFLGFTVVWAGQLTSILGTQMTGFAVLIYAWTTTQSATVMALVGIASFAPAVLFSPVAGTLVDRLNRKLVMILSDLGAALATALLLVLFVTGALQVWHLYPILALAGTLGSFHFPAYSAAVTLMIPKRHYARASGMISLAGSLAAIFAPVAGALLIVSVGLVVVFLIDLATAAAAVGTVAVVHVPQPSLEEEDRVARGSFWGEMAYGLRYILQRRSLLGLQLVFFGVNLVSSFAYVLLAPMVLARTGDDAVVLSSVLSAGAVGQVVGGVVLGVWGGPRRRIHGVLLGMVLASLAGQVAMGLGRDGLVWSGASFLGGLFVVLVNGSNQAIWQSKVAPSVQGRVFAFRRLIAQASAPLAMAMAGPLADGVFEPGMQLGGTLVPAFGGLVGTGAGAGMALLVILAGVSGALVGAVGYAFRSVREVEDLLPDYDAVPAEARAP